VRAAGPAAAALLLVSTLASAAESQPELPALVLQGHCDECHTVSSVAIGPPFIAVALRYRAEGEAAVEVLARKIIAGGGGNWGVVPMVPNERVSLSDARAMARWILTLQTK
jgi:cytochrome c